MTLSKDQGALSACCRAHLTPAGLCAACGEQSEALHEQRVVGHVSGRKEYMDTCVCGNPWPCPPPLAAEPVANVRRGTMHFLGLSSDVEVVQASDFDRVQSDLAQARESLAAREAECRVKARALDKLQADLTEAKREKAAAMGLVEGHAITIGKLEADLTEARTEIEKAVSTLQRIEYDTVRMGPTVCAEVCADLRAFLAKAKGAV